MNEVLDAQPAASSPAPVVETAVPANLPVSSVRERISSLAGDDLAHYRATGEFPEDKTPAAEPSPAPETTQATDSSSEATKGPEVATGEDDQEPTPVNESEKAKKARIRNAARWDEVIEERGRLKAENEILRKQLAEGTAPKTSTVEAAKPGEIETPDLDDYLEQGKTTKEWQKDYAKAVRAQAKADAEAIVESAFTREKTVTQNAKAGETFQSRVNAAKAVHADYDAVVAKAIYSPAMLDAMRSNEQFAEILYQLGMPEHVAEATRIAKLTDIDGLDYKALSEASKTNPVVRDRIHRAIGRAESEIERFAEKLTAPPEKPRTASGKFAPSSTVQVPAKGTAVGDPIAEALARKDTRTYIRLMREAETRELKNSR